MASRYWVGGSNTWNNSTANWSATDGGGGGATVPGAADDVFFTALSGAVTVTWNNVASPTVLTIVSTGFTGTHATGGFAKTLAGTGAVWNSPATCTITGAPTLTVSSTGSTAISVTCNHASPSATNAPNFSFTGGTYALTLGGTGVRDLVFTGFAGSIAGGTNPTCYGSITLSSGGTFTSHGPTMVATGTFTSLGKTIAGITVNAVGGTVTLADAMTAGTTSTTTLTAGTLALAGFTLSTGIFSSSNSNTRAISFGSGNIALTSVTAATTILVSTGIIGFSWTGTGGFTRNQAATASIGWGTLSGGTAARAINFSVTAGASQLTINSGSYINNLIFTGSTCTVTSSNVNIAGNLTLATGGTYTSLTKTFINTSTVTSSGRTHGNTTIDAVTVTLADAMTLGTANTLTLTAGTLDLANFTLSCGIFSSSNSNTRAVSFGSGNIALTSTTAATTVLSMATATGFTFTGTGGFTRNQAATATMVFGTTGGTVSNAPNLTVNAGASTLAITSGSYFKNLYFTGSTCMVTATSLNMAGNLTFASGGSYLTVQQTFLATATITSVGKQINNTTINGSGITVTLADAMTLGSASTLTLTQGTFTAANFNVTVGSFSSSNSNTRTLNMGSGTWTMLGNGATVWNTATTTGLTVVPSTSTITMTNASAKTFAGGGLTYYNLNQGGAGALTISGSNTFNNITDTVQPSTVTFTAGTTQTVSNFDLAGTAGSLVTINSSTPGSQFTLSKASGTVNAQYLSIKDSNATGGAVWNADATNVDGGNNTGWLGFAVAATGNFFLMF